MPFIYSTLSCDQRYVKWSDAPAGGTPREERSILISGGANVANKNIITPQGVVTEVSEADLALLNENTLFQTHVKNGHITVQQKEVQVEKAVADMEKRDESAPLTPQDYEVSGQKAPTTKKKKSK